jgi:hypothetical protein
MDWIERLTGLNPDNGSGIFELVIVAFIVIAIAMAVFLRRHSRARNRG